MCRAIIIRILLPAMLVIVYSCQRTITDRYTEDELFSILLDAHTLGLIYNRQEVRNDSLKMAYFEVLEQRYGLNQEEFEKLVDELIQNAELYDKIYTRMSGKMEKMEQMEMEILTE